MKNDGSETQLCRNGLNAISSHIYHLDGKCLGARIHLSLTHTIYISDIK